MWNLRAPDETGQRVQPTPGQLHLVQRCEVIPPSEQALRKKALCRQTIGSGWLGDLPADLQWRQNLFRVRLSRI